MSTFTQFNGPIASRGPSTTDITNLIDAYTNLKSILDRHMNDDIDTNNAHRGHDYVESVKRDIQSAIDGILARVNTLELNKVDNPANGHLINSSELNDYVTVNTLRSRLAEYISNTDLTNLLQSYVKHEDYDRFETVVSEACNSYDLFVRQFKEIETEEFDTTILELDKALSSAEFILSVLRARRMIDFTEWQTVSMQFAGTGAEETQTNGLYVIGKLSDDWRDDKTPPTQNIYKSARAFIKYEDGAPFDAVIDMVVTKSNDSFTGAINAIISKKPNSWNNLCFHLCRCTDYEGKEAVYLCVSADGLAKNDSAYANWYVHACGINFIPLTEKHIGYVQLVDDHIASTAPVKAERGSCISISGITIGELYLDIIRDSAGADMLHAIHTTDETGVNHHHLVIGDKKYETTQFHKRPVLVTEDPENPENNIIESKFATVKDIQDISGIPLGSVLQWPLYEEIYEYDNENNPVIDDLTGEPKIKLRRAIHVPAGYIPTDGSILYSAEYSELSAVMHHENDEQFTLPIIDCGIIKAKMDIAEGNNDDTERITVLNYNQIVTLLKNTSDLLKKEIARSKGMDTQHDQSIDIINASISDIEQQLNNGETND